MNASRTRYFAVDRLAVEAHPTRADLGRAAAAAVASYLRGVIAQRGAARVIFACAPSQNEFLESLIAVSTQEPTAFDWSKITAFHMDDYIGIRGDHPQSFRRWLREHLLDRVRVGAFHPLRAEDPDIPRLCADYAALLSQAPIDLICLGVGENGHIAFNDPPVADFGDPALVKPVEIDRECRQQQVNDGCFPNLDAVPVRALTLTIPVFRQARRLSVHVPGERKRAAVQAALQGPIDTACPASILRLHPDATLYLDAASAP